MTHATADRLHVAAAWLDTLPLPEPYAVHKFVGQAPMVSWHCDSDTALHVVSTIGGSWDVGTNDDHPQTVAVRDVDHLGTRIAVIVVVTGVNLPDLATMPRVESEHRYHYPRQAGDRR